MGDESAPAWIPSVTDSAPQFFSALCEGGFICFAPFLVPRHVSNPIDDVEGELCFRYMSEQLVLVRQDQLNQTDAVRIFDPPVELVAQPVKPERSNLVKRVLLYERQPGLSKVIPEAPNRSQKVVSMLKCSVIETINGAPF